MTHPDEGPEGWSESRPDGDYREHVRAANLEEQLRAARAHWLDPDDPTRHDLLAAREDVVLTPAIVAEIRGLTREAVARALDQESDRLWGMARKYGVTGPGSLGLCVDMTNVAGAFESLRAALGVARPDPAPPSAHPDVLRAAQGVADAYNEGVADGLVWSAVKGLVGALQDHPLGVADPAPPLDPDPVLRVVLEPKSGPPLDPERVARAIYVATETPALAAKWPFDDRGPDFRSLMRELARRFIEAYEAGRDHAREATPE